MERVFFLDEIVVEEVVPEDRPKAVSFSDVEFVEEIRVEFLRSFEEVFEIVSPIIFVEPYVSGHFSFEREADFRKIPNE